jgi:hypothetical protein
MTKEQILSGGTTVLDMRPHKWILCQLCQSSPLGLERSRAAPCPSLAPAARKREKNMQDGLARPDHILLPQRAPPG